MEENSLTSILGWVSIACWIVVYSPQLYENFRRKSGEGLSIAFVVVWLIGDLLNLVGAVMAGLLSTVIILALYYTLCDIMLLCQVYYYRWIRKLRHSSRSSTIGEEAPLITPSSGASTNEPEPSTTAVVVRYTAALAFVCATGIAAWWIGEHIHQDSQTPSPRKHKNEHEWLIQFFGWSSAVLYLGARVPQITKNVQTKCEGLSPALFFYAIVGNLTYSLSICSVSMEREYLMRSAGWLAGSALTVFLDLIVLGQFFYYRSRRSTGS